MNLRRNRYIPDDMRQLVNTFTNCDNGLSVMLSFGTRD